MIVAVAVLVKPPPVPLTVSVRLVLCELEVTVTVSVDVPGPVIDVGLRAGVMPVTPPVTVNATGEANVPDGVTVTV